MHDVGKTIATIANVCVILVTLMVGIVFVKNHILKPKALSSRKATYLIGAKLPLSNIDWTKNNQTLLFVLQKGCGYCTESASFYQRIVNHEKIKAKTHFIAVFPNSISEGTEYLKQLSIPISEIKEASLNDTGIRGTPTLLLVDSSGVIKNVWLGKLSESKENEVISVLQ